MAKTIALQSTNQTLINRLREQGYKVIDMYEAHRQRAIVDAYLYTSYHPDAFNSYYSVAETSDIMLGDTAEASQPSATIMLNITNLQPEEIVLKLERRLQQKRWGL
ncbi:MAG: hypothetical protein H7X79_06905 [Sporomusaceae bacterium]|nr:hypothetical protein [Sporomusaceae bacterium]